MTSLNVYFMSIFTLFVYYFVFCLMLCKLILGFYLDIYGMEK